MEPRTIIWFVEPVRLGDGSYTPFIEIASKSLNYDPMGIGFSVRDLLGASVSVPDGQDWIVFVPYSNIKSALTKMDEPQNVGE